MSELWNLGYTIYGLAKMRSYKFKGFGLGL